MSWPIAAYGLLGLALLVGFGWYERSRPDARTVALVGTLAAFAALGRIAFAAVPNVKPTSDIVLIAGFTLGAGPGFAVGAIAGLSSNFFFGQGPWTPWQMAAWGATGVLGALLARLCAPRAGAGREPDGVTPAPRIGRWPLALVCAAAGFAFTAVQDVGDWITYSGHGLAALAAYVGQGLGFDTVYAAASFGFALAFGPALLRSVQRFTRRIEVRWVEPGTLGRGLGVVLLAGVVAAALAAAGRPPSAHARTLSPLTARAARYLERAENRDGGLGAAPGAPSAELFSGWAALGLASAGVDVSGVRRAPGDPSLLHYVRAGASPGDTGSLERTILALRAAGASATAPRDLVATLVREVSARGAVSGQVNLTAFAVLALRAAGGGSGSGSGSAASAAARARAVGWLAGEADRDGGYGFDGRGGQSDADDTGAVLEALAGAPGRRVRGARRRAIAFLRHDQDADGGFPAAPGAGSNAQSTAWAIQGLLAAGVAPGALRRGGHTPVGYLDGLVTGDGAVRYARGQTQTPVWVTGEALLALTGTPLPVVGRPAAAASPSTGPTTRTSDPPTMPTAPASRPVATPARARGLRRAARRRPAAPRGPAPRRPAPAAAPMARAITRMERAVASLPGRVIAGVGLGR